ncbi:hypothetical protein DICVIV_11718 [Dictyocaulus viviparus]|uniref:Uncharacterized protein n=1 Tax=Dictyocaulus viviparus TaxID=29172 RepID=A0A0D8XF33_DICVI|nr:hypothetical protein DICVIV_11718 [Dictyocaulus viviparus]
MNKEWIDNASKDPAANGGISKGVREFLATQCKDNVED